MKKRWLVGIIILVVLIIIITALIFTGKKEICGPAFLGGGRNSSYCDRSCDVDNDCKFVCGCGIINKDETCDTTGAEVDCAAPGEIKCVEGKCVELKRPVNEGVIISTDKTEYNQGEIVNARVSFEGELYAETLNGFSIWKDGWSIYKFEKDNWTKLELGYDLCYPTCNSNVLSNKTEGCWHCDPGPTKAYNDSYYHLKWNQDYVQGLTPVECIFSPDILKSKCIVFAKVSPGKYKVRFTGFKDSKVYDPIYAEAEFIIK